MIDLNSMLEAYKALGREALTYDHYDLEAECPENYTSDEWREFLDNPTVREYIKKEMRIVKTAQVNKLINNAGDSHSVGQSQALSALTKIEDSEKEAEGPVFIYCYVPLNEEQKFANNVMEVDEFGLPKTPPLSN